ncbi:MAG: sigma-70 family RNA polymerase sigma factor [Acidobacteria bacterium]|nr:sigma-70 family RNA polymerase sigma factor [Acidobacteriota bacterium]
MHGETAEVYDELRKIAAIHLSRSARQPSLQATQLVHEAWIRLADKGWKSKTHFLALASRTMRMVLIDSIRARMAAKRQGSMERIELAPGFELATPEMPLSVDQLLELDRALDELGAEDERKARIIEMHFFAGLEFQEIAEALEISLSTVKRDWQFSRAWLYARLRGRGDDEARDNNPRTGNTL